MQVALTIRNKNKQDKYGILILGSFHDICDKCKEIYAGSRNWNGNIQRPVLYSSSETYICSNIT